MIVFFWVELSFGQDNTTQNINELSSHKIWESFLLSPNNHTHIPNNSFTGYQYGKYNFYEGNDLIGKIMPGFIYINITDFGASDNDKEDDTEAVLGALKELNPGEILYFPEGEYYINDMLRIKFGNIGIKGDGPGQSILHFQKSLSDILGPYWKNAEKNYNRWSNHGGLIWVAPEDIWDKDGRYVFQEPTPEGLDIGWFNTTILGEINQPSNRGDKTIKYQKKICC